MSQIKPQDNKPRDKAEKPVHPFPGWVAAQIIRQCGRFPLHRASQLGDRLGRAIWPLARESRRITERNIALCFPDLDPAAQRVLVRASVIETIQTSIEMASIWHRPATESLATITHTDNQPLMDAAYAKGKGVILIAPHFGNWELANQYAAAHYPMLAMYKPGRHEAINRLIYTARSRTSEMVAADRKGVMAMLKALGENKISGILPDQEPTLSSGTWAPFFGVTALTPMLIGKLLKRSGAAVLGFGCQRNPAGNGFHAFYEPVSAAIYDTDPVISATALNESIERIIQRDPTQYQWEYKRFKRRPDGSANPYRD